jgi:REP element-mobilizing transposase RayT
MPKRNLIRDYGDGQYYHVYNRGVAKMDIFRDRADYMYFTSLLQQYLSPERSSDNSRRTRKNYHEDVDLIAYCLMPNHFHMFVYLKKRDGLARLMSSAMTAYSMYFNKRYDRVGGLFEGSFLASRITTDAYFWNISRYIHLNPIDITKNYLDYPYSSVRYFISTEQVAWLRTSHVISSQEDMSKYPDYLQDYQSLHDMYKQIKHELAHE